VVRKTTGSAGPPPPQPPPEGPPPPVQNRTPAAPKRRKPPPACQPPARQTKACRVLSETHQSRVGQDLTRRALASNPCSAGSNPVPPKPNGIRARRLIIASQGRQALHQGVCRGCHQPVFDLSPSNGGPSATGRRRASPTASTWTSVGGTRSGPRVQYRLSPNANSSARLVRLIQSRGASEHNCRHGPEKHNPIRFGLLWRRTDREYFFRAGARDRRLFSGLYRPTRRPGMGGGANHLKSGMAPTIRRRRRKTDICRFFLYEAKPSSVRSEVLFNYAHWHGLKENAFYGAQGDYPRAS